MAMAKFLTLIGMIVMLGGCGSTPVETYASEKPVMEFDSFFNGALTGHAIVQDRNGKIIKRFVVHMVGEWNGDHGTLKEHFVYNDGEIQDRVWTIRKLADGSFVGTAPDIVGEAPGKSAGNAIQWKYVMKLDVSGHKINIAFDDWMFLVSDDLVINRSYMSKFGINVGQITISISKDKPLK
ncbi:MAG: hypothetical protein JWO78_1486 [Micavibrio sp.]|nr:hypothetical protein [Micavibrio sp.]